MRHRSKNTFFHIFVFTLFIAKTTHLAIYYPGGIDATGGNTLALCDAINNANLSSEDDIISLSGFIFDFSAACPSSPDVSTALPHILSSGKLSLVNGTIRRNPAASNLFRILYNEGSLYLFNITVDGGSIADLGGGIYNIGTLTIENSTMYNNTSTDGGGAIYNNGTIATISNSVVSNNTVPTRVGGTFGGAGILNNAIINIISNTTIANNTSDYAAGIYNFGSLTTISNSAITGNLTHNNGAGILNAGNITTIVNSTFSNNVAHGIRGGAILNSGTIVTISNNTIVRNSAVVAGGIFNFGTIDNLISNVIAGNTGSPTSDYGGPSIISNEGYNLFSTQPLSLSAPTDIIQTNAALYLGPLQDNGGPTYTIALLPGSLAINTGFNYGLLRYDQRGAPFYRVYEGVIDRGAFELQAMP